jgi:uncharacterized metal-binding protein
MPSGKTHQRLEAALLVLLWTPLLIWCLIRRWAGPTDAIGFGFAYGFSMALLSPDLDLRNSAAFQRWGPLRWLWIPYAAMFRHRRISHHLLLGPLTRVLYLGLFVLAGALVVLVIRGRAFPPATVSIRLLLAVLVGLYVPNATHICADRIDSAWRRRRRL